MLLTGSSLWAYIIGSACGIIATLDPALIQYRQTLDELNFFVKDQAIPQELTVKLRSYFRNTMYYVRVKRYEALLQKMSMRLRGDTAYEMCRVRLRQVPYLVHHECVAPARTITRPTYPNVGSLPCCSFLGASCLCLCP